MLSEVFFSVAITTYAGLQIGGTLNLMHLTTYCMLVLAGLAILYSLPVLLAINVPARYGAMLLDNWKPVVFLGGGAVIALFASRAFFKFALRSYQSASS